MNSFRPSKLELVIILCEYLFFEVIVKIPAFLYKRTQCLFLGHNWSVTSSYYSGPFIRNGMYCKRCGKFNDTGPTVCR
jgi:hypothetical protein